MALQIDEKEQDKGGRILPGKKWRVFNFVVEVAVESPGDVDEEEAAEDAAEFMASRSRRMGRVHTSFCSITRVDEYGARRPEGAVVIINRYPKGEQAELELPRGNKQIKQGDTYEKVMKVKPSKAKPKKAIKKKSKARF